MSAPRPWWASDGPVDGGVDPAEDPLVAHREARRGPDPDAPADDASVTHDTDADPASGPTHHDRASGPTHPGSEICGVCPVCIAARVLGETRPELLMHLAEAGRHVSAALRTLLETPTDRGESRRGGSEDRRVRRIDLDP